LPASLPSNLSPLSTLEVTQAVLAEQVLVATIKPHTKPRLTVAGIPAQPG